MTNREAAKLVEAALASGRVLTVPCPNGDTLTVGPEHRAVPYDHTRYVAIRWGRSRWALPSGLTVSSDAIPNFVAWAVVEHCGRGNAAREARKVLP